MGDNVHKDSGGSGCLGMKDRVSRGTRSHSSSRDAKDYQNRVNCSFCLEVMEANSKMKSLHL